MLGIIKEFIRKIPFNADVMWTSLAVAFLFTCSLWFHFRSNLILVILYFLLSIFFGLGIRNIFLHFNVSRHKRSKKNKTLQELEKLSSQEEKIIREMVSSRSDICYKSFDDPYIKALQQRGLVELYNGVQFVSHIHLNPYKMPNFVWEAVKNDLRFFKTPHAK